MPITRDDVEKVALLARLQLSRRELDQMTEQLGQIVGYVDLLAEVDTDRVEPMAAVWQVEAVQSDYDWQQVLSRLTFEAGEVAWTVPLIVGDAPFGQPENGPVRIEGQWFRQ